ncbi:unnamed protein product, partial [Iphiclides podalirius]
MVAPRITLSTRYILSELEEIEREDNFRLKRFKELKTKKKGKDSVDTDEIVDEMENNMCISDEDKTDEDTTDEDRTDEDRTDKDRKNEDRTKFPSNIEEGPPLRLNTETELNSHENEQSLGLEAIDIHGDSNQNLDANKYEDNKIEGTASQTNSKIRRSDILLP